MKSKKQILQDKAQMDIEQQECVQQFSVPQRWVLAAELNVWYDQLNKTLFNSILPKVLCYWSPPVFSFLGQCHIRRHPKTKYMHSVAIIFPSNSPNGALYDTMIHEMVHVYQSVINTSFAHNKFFYRINNIKRATYLHQNNGNPDIILYPPRNTKKNKMWQRAHDIEKDLLELSELLFEEPIPIPICWWHSTKTRTRYRLESYWCHTEQTSKPNNLELSKKSFSPSEKDLIYILCTIASWKAKGEQKRREYRNEIFERKKEEYFGPPTTFTFTSPSLSKKQTLYTDEELAALCQQLEQDRKEGRFYTPRFIVEAMLYQTEIDDDR